MSSWLQRVKADIYSRRMVRLYEKAGNNGINVKGVDWLSTLYKKGLEHLAAGGGINDPYSQVDAVYIAVSTIATSGASVTYKLKTGETDLPPDHPLRRLLVAPNQSMRGNQIFEGTFSYLELDGVAYWHLDKIARTSAGGPRLPTRIRLLPPKKVKPKLDAEGELVGWKVTTDAGEQDLSVDEVIRIAYFNPNDPFKPMAPLTAARLGYNLHWKSSVWQDRFFEHGGVPPFYISLPPGVTITSEAERDKLRTQFRDRYLGLRNAGKPPIMQKGAELKSVAINQRDAEWIATQKLTTVQILGVFKVPPAVGGVFEDANHAHTIEQKRYFWNHTMPPKLELFSTIFQSQFLDRFLPGVTFEWDLIAKRVQAIPEDIDEAVKSAQKLWGLGVPARDAFDLFRLPIPKNPVLEVSFLPFNVMPAELVLNPPEPEPPPPAEDDPEPPTGDDPDDEEEASILRLPKTWRETLWRQIEARLDHFERALLGNYRGFLAWYEAEVIKRIGSNELSMNRDVDSWLPSKTTYHHEVKVRTKGTRTSTIEEGYLQVLAEVGIEGSFDVLDPLVIEAITTSDFSIEGASDTMTAKMRASLAEGVQLGEGPGLLQARVKGFITEQRKGQAKTVARTEVAGGYNNGRFASMKKNGIPKQQWLTAGDEDVRTTHMEQNGTERALGDTFPNGLRYPHDPNGPPSERVNCRCVALPIT